MPEQPPKMICEICGGAHPIDAHVAVGEIGKTKEPAREAEPNREAMEKVVDIFTAKDLKYRNDVILPTLETGIPTPLTSFFYRYFGRVDEGAKAEMRQAALEREQERMGAKIQRHPYSLRANVFYPEGLLKSLRDLVLDTKTVEFYSKVKNIETSTVTSDWGDAVPVLRYITSIIKDLSADLKDTVTRNTGISLEKISKLLAAERIRPKIAHPATDDEKELKRVLEALLSDAEVWEAIRRGWLKRFFTQTQKGGQISGLITNYNLELGVVLSPNTKVAVSPNQDYPTQATIMSPRVKPKDIVGIFVNSDCKVRWGIGLMIDEAIQTPDPYYGEETTLGQLEHSVFRTPQHPAEYLLKREYARPFLFFAEEQGIERSKLEMYVEEFKAAEKAWYESDEAKSPTGSQWWVRAENISDRFRKALGDETHAMLETLARKFLEEKSPVKSGETLWTGLTRLAEQHQLPIYNTRGELLWPKRMSHDGVVKFVTKKNPRS